MLGYFLGRLAHLKNKIIQASVHFVQITDSVAMTNPIQVSSIFQTIQFFLNTLCSIVLAMH